MRDVLERAKAAKDDEFYTLPETVEEVMGRLLAADPLVLAGRTVLLPCDGVDSAFFRWFSENWFRCGVAEVRACRFRPGGAGEWVKLSRDGRSAGRFTFDGDFRSPEVADFASGCDMVVTNPPFSLLDEFLEWCESTVSDYTVVMPLPKVTSKRCWPFFSSGRLRLADGRSLSGMEFARPGGGRVKLGFSVVASTLPMASCGQSVRFGRGEGTQSANYAATTYARFADIPNGGSGVMAVPVGVFLSPIISDLNVLGVSQRWDEGGERLKTVRFGQHLKCSNKGFLFGGSWLNQNLCVEIPGPPSDGGAFYVHDGRFYKLLFTRVFVQWK